MVVLVDIHQISKYWKNTHTQPPVCSTGTTNGYDDSVMSAGGRKKKERFREALIYQALIQ